MRSLRSAGERARHQVLIAVLALAVGLGALAALAPARSAMALDNGVARVPPMGWNDWNSFDCNVSESLVRQTADAIVSKGLAPAGYTYVVVDDCWFNPSRDSAGNLQGDPSRFPAG
jgi:alpha-galactosidase